MSTIGTMKSSSSSHDMNGNSSSSVNSSNNNNNNNNSSNAPPPPMRRPSLPMALTPSQQMQQQQMQMQQQMHMQQQMPPQSMMIPPPWMQQNHLQNSHHPHPMTMMMMNQPPNNHRIPPPMPMDWGIGAAGGPPPESPMASQQQMQMQQQMRMHQHQQQMHQHQMQQQKQLHQQMQQHQQQSMPEQQEQQQEPLPPHPAQTPPRKVSQESSSEHAEIESIDYSNNAEDTSNRTGLTVNQDTKTGSSSSSNSNKNNTPAPELFSPRSTAAMALSSIGQSTTTTASTTTLPRSEARPSPPLRPSPPNSATAPSGVPFAPPPPNFMLYGMPPPVPSNNNNNNGAAGAPWNTPLLKTLPPPPPPQHYMMGYHAPFPNPPMLTGAPVDVNGNHTPNHHTNPMVTPTPGKKLRNIQLPISSNLRAVPDQCLSVPNMGGVPSPELQRPVSNSDDKPSRKKQSLGMLAETFVQRYRQYPRDTPVVIDDVAKDLDVERRRIYDVVNILEAIKIVVKKGKNTYHWMGTRHLDYMFALLQKQACKDFPQDVGGLGLAPSAPPAVPLRAENKSLSKLSQQFLECFLVGPTVRSLQEATAKIFPHLSDDRTVSDADLRVGETRQTMLLQQQRSLKTKVRRLYDIANVYTAVGILAKVVDGNNNNNNSANSSATKPRRNASSSRPQYVWVHPASPAQLLQLYQRLPPVARDAQDPFVALAVAQATTHSGGNPNASASTVSPTQPCAVPWEPRRVSLPPAGEAAVQSSE